jgi:regulator of protease activity HflC (stomatin/prohibitin superfamily)
MKYYSEKLKKLFDTESELTVAEKVVDEENEKKKLASEQKKEEASKVEDAFKARNAARREYNTKLVEARKIYNDAIIAAKRAFNETLTTATDAKDKAEEAYNTALKEFTAKYESYHMTLKDGDNVVTISNASDKNFETMGKEFNSFLDSLLNIWKL